jgi:hypothetical protein
MTLYHTPPTRPHVLHTLTGYVVLGSGYLVMLVAIAYLTR